MTLHLPGGTASRPDRAKTGPGTWTAVRDAPALNLAVKDLGGGRIGLCPDADLCVPVPMDAMADDAVRLDALAEPLGLVIADDGVHAVVRSAPQSGESSRLRPGDELDVVLPDLDGHQRRIVSEHGRSAAFVWASW